mmetsp:Transcript_100040/g.172642  ORF Transcript_100040/g.172642 Transcript_100040/m.172642 type:complete len:212 (-) Transcript_100040:313-948(-)
MLGRLGLGDHRNALLDLPPQRHLGPGLAVPGPNRRDQGPVDEFRCAARATEGREAGVRDPVGLTERLVIRRVGPCLPHSHVELHLIDGDGAGRDGHEVLQVPLAVVRHADRPRLPRSHKGLHRPPLLDPLRRPRIPEAPVCWEVHEHQVHVLQPQLLQTELQSGGCRRGIQPPRDLGREEVAGPRAPACSEGGPDALLVAVPQGSVDEFIA